MRKLFAVMLVCLLCAMTAYAAEWPEGLGPAKPLPGVRELELDKEMGYSYTFPRPGLEAERFCDVLEIYLPRTDIALGAGHARLYTADDQEVADIDFSNPDQVLLREQTEEELAAKKWGSGVCIEMYLPVSLKFDTQYYVLMDLNCFTAGEGKVSNYDLVNKDQWTPFVAGDFGVGGLYYSAAPELPVIEPEEGEETAETEATEAPEEAPVEPKYNPVTGDRVHLDLVLGGDAKTAVIFSENDSVRFDKVDYTESCTVSGTVSRDDLDWGVVFLDENDDVLDVVKLAVPEETEEAEETAEVEEAEEAE